MAARFWVGGTGNWNDTAYWSTASGGAGGASVPTSVDTATFDTNSGTGTCTTTAGAICAVMTMNSANMTLSLGANFTAGSFIVEIGTILLNSYTAFISAFGSANANVRTINFGTGKFSVDGAAAQIWDSRTVTNATITGSRLVELTYSGNVGTRTVLHGATGGSEANALSISVVAGSDIISNGNNSRFADFQFSNFTGAWNPQNCSIFGNVTLATGMTTTSSVQNISLSNTSGIKTFTSNGVTVNFILRRQIANGKTLLTDAFTMGSGRALTLVAGEFDAGNQNVTIPSLVTAAGTKTLTLGSGTWTITDGGTSWNPNASAAGLTVTPSTGTISMTSASAKTFAGGGFTWPTLNQGGAGALTIEQSNTFTNITNTVQPATVTLTAGTTQTVTDFDLSGTSGNLITLNSSTAGTKATLTDSGGVNSVSYLDIKDISATGYGEWQAYTSNGNVDSGGNTGWVFTAPPPLTASEYQISLKSFTERRSF